MPCIKVGLNEWILINSLPCPMALWTDGLAGCVAVTIYKPHRAFMTHIYSGISVAEWNNKIEAEFKAAMKKFGDLDDAHCRIIVSRESNQKKSPLEEAVEKTLKDVAEPLKNDEKRPSNFDLLSEHGYSGMLVWHNPNSDFENEFSFDALERDGFRRDNGFEPAWGELMNSVTGPEYIEAHGFFSAERAKEAEIYPDRGGSYED
jgi:uncharacterized OsmC-like protein